MSFCRFCRIAGAGQLSFMRKNRKLKKILIVIGEGPIKKEEGVRLLDLVSVFGPHKYSEE